MWLTAPMWLYWYRAVSTTNLHYEAILAVPEAISTDHSEVSDEVTRFQTKLGSFLVYLLVLERIFHLWSALLELQGSGLVLLCTTHLIKELESARCDAEWEKIVEKRICCWYQHWNGFMEFLSKCPAKIQKSFTLTLC